MKSLQNKLITNRIFYDYLKKKNKYSKEASQCIERTVTKLLEGHTTHNRPGMLLGKIQSGKTRTFIGVSGLAFDNGYDMVIILTKGTKALAKQTIERLKKEFEGLKDDDIIQIYDIMTLPDNLIAYELSQKLFFVVKKEKNNMGRLSKALFQTYPLLSKKKILIIDDEADFASVGFSKTKQEIIEMNVIANNIDTIRNKLDNVDFLQVTATPYSLYLQPEDEKINGTNKTFEPIKPAFTELVPVPNTYIGGEYYFEESEAKNPIAAYIYEEIQEDELTILKNSDRRRFKIEDALISDKIEMMRSSLINFLVGGITRRIQDERLGKRPKKYSFIIHTEQAKQSHKWQESIAIEIKDQLKKSLNSNQKLINKLLNKSYDDLKRSLSLSHYIPSYDEIQREVLVAIKQDNIMITKVNSEKDVDQLLDETGQLKLRAPLNIFIGGQILDRGITIGNLIGFYYGRNPQKFQQDTVLQHSRMFGYRPMEDLMVTRFYTTKKIHDVMKKIQEFDEGLRQALDKGVQDQGVVFIQKDEKNQIVPCSPNKILLSNTTTLKPLKRLLPIGFQTGYKSNISSIIKELDQLILNREDTSTPFLMNINDAVKIINKISLTFDTKEGLPWDVKAFSSSMEYFSNNAKTEYQNNVWGLVRTNRNISRKRSNNGYTDAPDTPKGELGELRLARKLATDVPVLMLLREQGDEKNGWRNCPFWWPVLVIPKNTRTVIFTSL
ncbi:Z1 domain-containing protein [Sporolactobacillus terrae]|uniref:Z1 domain-containing protein n=1 Tax=Sporolactobacillus terrae TaxID=269673 RepID=UPI00055C718A|nr:Z1 domain-containing protein [Sporolactobacillus terrae]